MTARFTVALVMLVAVGAFAVLVSPAASRPANDAPWDGRALDAPPEAADSPRAPAPAPSTAFG